MKVEVLALQEEWDRIIESAQAEVEAFKKISLKQLNFKMLPEKWSALECLDHLNQYAVFYLPEIERQIQGSVFKSQSHFKAGFLGNYFSNSMKVKNNGIKKIKSPKDKIPQKSIFDLSTLEQFQKDLRKIKELVQNSKNVDLSKTKCAISLTPLIKLRLGDTINFYLRHIERHVWQAKNAIVSSER
jgi:hypothetical protein